VETTTGDASDKAAVPGKRTGVRDDSTGAPGKQTRVDTEAVDNGALPGRLRSVIEALSGMSMADVRVHRNSSEPAKLQAAAFARGNEIHLGPGQEHQLAHEAWHVVQQKQGRVAPNAPGMGKLELNHDPALEAEAETMAARALALGDGAHATDAAPATATARPVAQLAPLGSVEHIRDSCFIAAIINSFAVTASLRNMLDPVANNLAPLVDHVNLQNLLHRAVNSVDQGQLVDAHWVQGIMTAMVRTGVIDAPQAQDVNQVMYELVRALQTRHGDAAGQVGPNPARAYAGQIEWIAGQNIQQALANNPGNGLSVPFSSANPANVIHIGRHPNNHQVAPPEFDVQALGGPIRYNLRSAVNRDTGSYTESHFISYVNRGNAAAPEWRENDDVGPRERHIPDLGNIQTDPALIEKRKERIKTTRGPDAVKSKHFEADLAPRPIHVDSGAVMYIYERAGAAAQPPVDGGTRVAPANAHQFEQGYLDSMFEHRAKLGRDGRESLMIVLRRKGADGKVQQMEKEARAELGTRLASGVAAMTGTDRAKQPKMGPSDDELARKSFLEQQKALLDSYATLARQPEGKPHFRAKPDDSETLVADVTRLFAETDVMKILAFSEQDILRLAGWRNVPIQLGLRRKVQAQSDLRGQETEFLQRLNGFLNNPVVWGELEPVQRDRLVAIHHQLGADSVVSGTSKTRGDESGVPKPGQVGFEPGLALFNDDSQSEFDEGPLDPEEEAAFARAHGHFSLFLPATFGNHIPQPKEEGGDIASFTGLGHSNTTATLMRGGHLVPRRLGPVLASQPNDHGHRRHVGRLPEDGERYEKDTPHDKLDAIAQKQKQVFDDQPTRINHAFSQTEKDRRGMRFLMGASMGWTEQSRLADDEHDPALETEREQLAPTVDPESLSGQLVHRFAGKRAESHDHAESQVVRTRLWRAQTARIVDAIGRGEATTEDDTLQLVLNRSNCEGCARRLVLEAIRFWTAVAANEEQPCTWQQALALYRDPPLLAIAFSGNYHQENPDRFQLLCQALLEVGWAIQVHGRHKSTPAFTVQNIATLTALHRAVKAHGEGASVQVSESLRGDVAGHDELLEMFPKRRASSEEESNSDATDEEESSASSSEDEAGPIAPPNDGRDQGGKRTRRDAFGDSESDSDGSAAS
jgi:hypothetical protein